MLIVLTHICQIVMCMANNLRLSRSWQPVTASGSRRQVTWCLLCAVAKRQAGLRTSDFRSLHVTHWLSCPEGQRERGWRWTWNGCVCC